MKCCVVDASPLPRSKYYEDEDGKVLREVFAYLLIDGEWKFYARGTWRELKQSLRNRTGVDKFINRDASNFRVSLDQPMYRPDQWRSEYVEDRRYLNPCGTRLELDQFYAWIQLKEHSTDCPQCGAQTQPLPPAGVGETDPILPRPSGRGLLQCTSRFCDYVGKLIATR